MTRDEDVRAWSSLEEMEARANQIQSEVKYAETTRLVAEARAQLATAKRLHRMARVTLWASIVFLVACAVYLAWRIWVTL